MAASFTHSNRSANGSELHPSLSDGQREYDLDLATERVFGELLDLRAGDLLPEDVDPMEIADELRSRYKDLWCELTREEILRPDEQRYRIAERLRRLNELGGDRRGREPGQAAAQRHRQLPCLPGAEAGPPGF